MLSHSGSAEMQRVPEIEISNLLDPVPAKDIDIAVLTTVSEETTSRMTDGFLSTSNCHLLYLVIEQNIRKL